MNINLVADALSIRKQLLEVFGTEDFASSTESVQVVDHLVEDVRRLARDLSGLPEYYRYEMLAQCLEIVGYLSRWYRSRLDATGDDAKLKDAADSRITVALNLVRDRATDSTLSEVVVAWLEDLKDVSIENIVKTAKRVLEIPWGSIYRKGRSTPDSLTRVGPDLGIEEELFAVKAVFLLNNVPWNVPQTIQAGIRYNIDVEVEVANWSNGSDGLRIDYVTTLTEDMIAISPVTIDRKDSVSTYTETGSMIVHNPQLMSSKPVAIRVRARYISNGQFTQDRVHVLGTTELRFKAVSASSLGVLSHYPMIDARIPGLVAQLEAYDLHLPQSDLDDFAACLHRVAQYAAVVLDSSHFKGSVVDEVKDFQSHIVSLLRMTELGGEVREGEVSAGGRIDLRYRNVIIELKVEREISNRQKIFETYSRQPTQYGAPLLPVSIVVVLDMSEKDLPPGNIGYNLHLQEVPVHGFEEDQTATPHIAAFVVIDGNLRSPSSYSRS